MCREGESVVVKVSRPTRHLVNNVERREVAEGSSGKNTVAVVQRTDVHHTQIQQLQQITEGTLNIGNRFLHVI